MQDVEQKFYRSGDRIFGGVCAGLAEGLHIDPLWVRVAFVILVFLQGVGLFIYIVLWLVMPERVEAGGQRSGFDAMSADLSHIWGEIRQQTGAGRALYTGKRSDRQMSADLMRNPDPAISLARRRSSQNLKGHCHA